MANSESRTTDAPPERRCACVSYDAYECVSIRYRRFDNFNSDEVEPCECGCHDEFDEWNRDDC